MKMDAARGEAHATSVPNLSEQLEAWKRHQASLAARVVLHDDADWLTSSGEADWQARLQLVGGLDISAFPAADGGDGGGGSGGVAALAVLSFPSLALRHLELLHLLSFEAPYVPGFLGFREVPAYLELLRRAAQQGVHPQLLLVDGFGVLHPRRCGSASQLGVLTGLPTVGVAKSLFAVDGLPGERQVRAAFAAASGGGAAAIVGAAVPAAGGEAAAEVLASEPELQRLRPLPGGGAWLPLETPAGEVLGAALCCAAGSQQLACDADSGGASGVPASSGSSSGRSPAPCRPVFVSVGHKVSLATVLAVVQRCCRHRVPEPIRQADLCSRAEVRRLQVAADGVCTY